MAGQQRSSDARAASRNRPFEARVDQRGDLVIGAEGARLVLGGDRPDTNLGGYYVNPTIFADVKNSMTIAREEIFGPVLCILPYDSEDEAVRQANFPATENLLVLADQFEELFRYRQRNPDEAERFVKLLLRSATEEVPIHVVMTMRSDFLGHAVAFHGYPRATADLDVWVAVHPDNADRLVRALRQFGFDLPDLNADLFLRPDRVRPRHAAHGPDTQLKRARELP